MKYPEYRNRSAIVQGTFSEGKFKMKNAKTKPAAMPEMDLNQIASDSAARVAAAREKEKRGRGRPKGSKKILEAGAEPAPVAVLSPAADPAPVAAAPNSLAENRDTMIKIYADTLVKPLYKALADMKGCPHLEVDDGEAKAQAAALNDLMAFYAPTMSAEASLWLGAGLAIGGTALQKMLIYSNWKAAQAKKPRGAAANGVSNADTAV